MFTSLAGAQRTVLATTTTRAAASCATGTRAVGNVKLRRTFHHPATTRIATSATAKATATARTTATSQRGLLRGQLPQGASLFVGSQQQRRLQRHPFPFTSPIGASPPPLRAFGDDGEGSLLDDLDADERCPVPKDQRPASQLREIQESILLGWGGLELKWYCFRLGVLGSFFYFFLAYPIAAYSYNPETQPVEAIICALVGSLTSTAAFALLIYNNWSYVRDRLLCPSTRLIHATRLLMTIVQIS